MISCCVPRGLCPSPTMGTFFTGGFMKNSQPVIPDGDPDVERSVNNFIYQLSVPVFLDRLTTESH